MKSTRSPSDDVGWSTSPATPPSSSGSGTAAGADAGPGAASGSGSGLQIWTGAEAGFCSGRLRFRGQPGRPGFRDSSLPPEGRLGAVSTFVSVPLRSADGVGEGRRGGAVKSCRCASPSPAAARRSSAESPGRTGCFRPGQRFPVRKGPVLLRRHGRGPGSGPRPAALGAGGSQHRRRTAPVPLQGGAHSVVYRVKDLPLAAELDLLLGGWTFTSTALSLHVKWRTQPGNLPTIFWLA